MMDFWTIMGWTTAIYVAIGAGIYLPNVPRMWRSASDDIDRDGGWHCHVCFALVVCMTIVTWPQIFVEAEDDDY